MRLSLSEDESLRRPQGRPSNRARKFRTQKNRRCANSRPLRGGKFAQNKNN